ncbi:MAG: hypothetical protein WD009_04020 [Phycisphaeraceae bacterium]
MPTPMRPLNVPRAIVAPAVAGLFLLTLLAVRQYGLVGGPELLTLAIIAAALTLGIVAGLIYANYDSYARPGSRRCHNGTS